MDGERQRKWVVQALCDCLGMQLFLENCFIILITINNTQTMIFTFSLWMEIKKIERKKKWYLKISIVWDFAKGEDSLNRLWNKKIFQSFLFISISKFSLSFFFFPLIQTNFLLETGPLQWGKKTWHGQVSCSHCLFF